MTVRELDAMDPNDLRDCVRQEIEKLIEPSVGALRHGQQGRAGVAKDLRHDVVASGTSVCG
jgi:hypothetical protein